jgi:hypothetical protein
MAVQRYDVTESPEGGHFVTRYWAPVNSPIVEGEKVIGILHRVDDVTELEKDLRNVLTHHRRLAQSETAQGWLSGAVPKRPVPPDGRVDGPWERETVRPMLRKWSPEGARELWRA